MKAAKHLLPALIICAITACESDAPCSDNVVSRVNAGLYTLIEGEEVSLAVDQLSIHGISRPDSVLQGSNISEFVFPLSMQAESNSFIITADTLTDTLELFYTTKLAMISVQCGFTTNFEIQSLSFTKNFIDSISIVKSNVDLTDEENLKIFH